MLFADGDNILVASASNDDGEDDDGEDDEDNEDIVSTVAFRLNMVVGGWRLDVGVNWICLVESF